MSIGASIGAIVNAMGRGEDESAAFLAAVLAAVHTAGVDETRAFVAAWEDWRGDLSAFRVRCQRDREIAVARMLADEEEACPAFCFRDETRAILDRTAAAPPWTAGVVVITAADMALSGGPDAADDTVAHVDAVFRNMIAQAEAKIEALARDFVREFVGTVLDGCVGRAVCIRRRRDRVHRQVRRLRQQGRAPTISHMRARVYSCALCGQTCAFWSWVVVANREHRRQRHSRGRLGCGACRAVMYCGRACQKHDWKRHREVCRRRGVNTW